MAKASPDRRTMTIAEAVESRANFRRQIRLLARSRPRSSALFLYMFSDILLPFVAGMALAYFLDPVADRLERLGLSRTARDPRDPDDVRRHRLSWR